MRVCVIGTLSGAADEGFKNIANRFRKELATMHDVAAVDTSRCDLVGGMRTIRDFQPDILHYFTAPTLSSFMLLRSARIASGRRACTVASGLHANGSWILDSRVQRAAAAAIHPDLILSQSKEYSRRFAALGARTELFPNGVDTGRFQPVDAKGKRRLREAYGLDPDSFIALHVGHVNPTRGLDLFASIRQSIPDCTVLIVGSSHFATDAALKASLEGHGCTVWQRFFPRVEELYQMADCYVFPPARTILMPLSILEALSCNLPVVCYPFEGITTFLPEGEGLRFARSPEDFADAVREIRAGCPAVRTREAVLSFSWDHLTVQLNSMYTTLCGEKS